MNDSAAPSDALVVEEDHDGLRLDQFLTTILPGQSRSQIQRLIKEGHVTSASGSAVRASTAVRAGERYVVDVPELRPATPQAEALPLRIVFEDPDVVVLDKPAGMVVHPGAGHASGTLVNALLHHVKDLSGVGGEARPGIVHRLDRGTSGLMVVAKHDKAHQELARQFQDREVEKEYIALVWGVVQPGRRIDEPIGRDPKDRQKMSTRARRARSAVTRVTFARHFKGVSFIRVAIATGPYSSDPCASERNRPPDCRRPDLRRRAPPRREQPACGDAARTPLPARLPARLHAPGRWPARRVRLAAPAGARSGGRGYCTEGRRRSFRPLKSARPQSPQSASGSHREVRPDVRSGTPFNRASLRRQGLRRRPRPRADAERPRSRRRRDPPPAIGRDRPGARTGAGHPHQAVPLRGESVAVGAAGRQRRRRGNAGTSRAARVPRGNRPAAGHRGTTERDVSDARLLRRGDVLLPCVGAERAGARG